MQLLLNVEKLSQLKQILSDLKKGYTIVELSGLHYNKRIFPRGTSIFIRFFSTDLHEASPVARKY